MEASALTILKAIHNRHGIKRKELCELTGLSLNRVNTLVAELLDERLILETPTQEGTPGRPAGQLSINPAAGHVVGLDIGSGHSRVAVCDLGGHTLAQMRVQTRLATDGEAILNDLVALVEAICLQIAQPTSELTALGVGVHGIVDTRTHSVVDWPNTPVWVESWRGLQVTAALRARLGIAPVVVDDIVRGMGLAAYRSGVARGSRHFLYVFLGNGIGAGIFVDGKPYAGSRGIAGEVGHVIVDEGGMWCSCGNRGCLETVASTAAILNRAAARLADPQLMSTLRQPYEQGTLTLQQVILAADAGDKLAYQLLDEAGAAIGRVLATAVNLLGPETVVLGGPLAQAGEALLDTVRRQVVFRALPYVSGALTWVCDDQDEYTGARGIAMLALDAVFAEPAYAERLVRQRS